VAERLCFIVDTDVKYRENPEHQYWPDQMWQIRDKNTYWSIFSLLAELYYLYDQGGFHLIYVNIPVVNLIINCIYQILNKECWRLHYVRYNLCNH
jgi:hypothetical protein